MITIEKISRRHFLNTGGKFLAFIPFAGIISCIPNSGSKLSPEDSLKKLIFIIGPWVFADKSVDEGFTDRFLKSDHINQYLPKSARLIQSLSDRFPDNSWAIDHINLKGLSKGEQELLVGLTKQLYSFVEVRFYVSKEPTWGQCHGDSKWHIKVP
jgi:hypothetical protein